MKYKAEISHWWRPFYCPACEGQGSWVDVIDPDIGGPTETCGYCDGEGRVSLIRIIVWLCYVNVVDGLRARWSRKRKGKR